MKHLFSIGAFIALAGVISCVLHLIGMNLRILMWINEWGTGVGWGIRVGLIVLGVLMMVIASKAKSDDADG